MTATITLGVIVQFQTKVLKLSDFLKYFCTINVSRKTICDHSQKKVAKIAIKLDRVHKKCAAFENFKRQLCLNLCHDQVIVITAAFFPRTVTYTI